MVEVGETFLERVPIVRPIYRGLKQVFETLFSKSGSTFRTVGLVEFPAPGMWSLVFLSTPPGTDITAQLPSKEEYVSAFMPCTPNPTTGFFFYVLRSEIIELDIPVEAAAKLIMTAGMIQPGSNGDQQKRLAALAETAKAASIVRSAPGWSDRRFAPDGSLFCAIMPPRQEAGFPLQQWPRAASRDWTVCQPISSGFSPISPMRRVTRLRTTWSRWCCSAARRKAGSRRVPTST